jgi:DNA primase
MKSRRLRDQLADIRCCRRAVPIDRLIRRLWVEDLTGLLGLVKIWVVEVNSWGATVDDIEHPDTPVFDLDPGERVEWGFVARQD